MASRPHGLHSSSRRIALFLPSLGGGGAEKATVRLAGGLTEAGWDVDLVLVRATGPLTTEVPPEVRIIDLKARRILCSTQHLARYLASEAPSILLSALSPTNVVAVWACCLARYRGRLVLAEHTTLSASVREASDPRMRLLPALVRLTYPRADALVAVSQGVADDLAVTLGSRRTGIRVIPNPVVSEELHSLAAEPIEHPWFDAAEIERTPVLVSAGRLVRAKDYAVLLDAFRRLRGRRSARLLIMGEGPERRRLERIVVNWRLKSDVSMPGYEANPYRVLSRSSVFVLSSRREGLPTVLVEAAALGVPIVSTACGTGPAEVLGDLADKFLVPVGDASALARRIEEVLELTPTERNTVSRRLKHASERFTVRNAVSAYAQLFKELTTLDIGLCPPQC